MHYGMASGVIAQPTPIHGNLNRDPTAKDQPEAALELLFRMAEEMGA